MSAVLGVAEIVDKFEKGHFGIPNLWVSEGFWRGDTKRYCWVLDMAKIMIVYVWLMNTSDNKLSGSIPISLF